MSVAIFIIFLQLDLSYQHSDSSPIILYNTILIIIKIFYHLIILSMAGTTLTWTLMMIELSPLPTTCRSAPRTLTISSGTSDYIFNFNFKNSTFSMTAFAYYYLFFLHKVKYFGDDNETLEMNEDTLLIGELLFHFLCCVEENSHEVVEFHNVGSEYSGTLDSLYDGGDEVIKVIGAALNGVASLFNNSCDVNTVKFHQVCTAKSIFIDNQDLFDHFTRVIKQ